MKPTYRYAAGTHTFYRLRLAKDPLSMVKAARVAAEEEIAEAYGKLMTLNYRDAGYAALKDLYGKAVAEMFEGRNFFNRAVLADAATRSTAEVPGSLSLWRAVSLYARAQAHAREVFEALEPAPTTGAGAAALRRQLGDLGDGRRPGPLDAAGLAP